MRGENDIKLENQQDKEYKIVQHLETFSLFQFPLTTSETNGTRLLSPESE